MDAEFWHEMWERDTQGFHEAQGNAMFARYAPTVWPGTEQRIFIPLCGKTRDIGACLARGWSVVGAELSQSAVEALFEDLQMIPQVAAKGPLTQYAAGKLVVFVGNVFDLDATTLGPVTAIYDRAALVALPEEMRSNYARHLVEITGGVQQLLVTFEYDQAAMDGPPFSVPSSFVENVYGEHYAIEALESAAVPGQLKGRVDAKEQVWHLTPCA